MDGAINANPLARKLYAALNPIAKTDINVPAGIVIDLLYGFVMAGLFVLLKDSLPGNPWLQGLSYGAIMWFFRVLMMVVTQWMTLRIPLNALLYTLFTGLAEMLLLGLVYGLALQ
jgi:uncharacterized membrane protein YagU involved in acid resistance